MGAMPAAEYIPRIDQMAPQRLEVALFGMGCFLGFEPRFGITRGIWRTFVGYSGGRFTTPTYDDHGDHTEAVLVEYDPLTISYGQLLELFLLWLSPSKGAAVTPLRPQNSSIFVKNETERRLAQAALKRYDFHAGTSLHTRVLAFKTFHKAESWCQKYFLRTCPLMQELEHIYRSEESLLESPLATRLNGILGNASSSPSIPEDIEFYDLSEHAVHALKRLCGAE